MARNKAPKLKIREIVKTNGDYSWTTYMVSGWKEGGRYQRKQFKDQGDAERFVTLKQVELLNEERALTTVTTRLSSAQLIEAEHCVERLGDHTLAQATEFYLRHHIVSQRKVVVEVALREYVGEKERTLRESSLRQIETIGRQLLKMFRGYSMDAITTPDAIQYFDNLKTRDGRAPASPKTLANQRRILHAFFQWALKKRYVVANPIEGVPKIPERSLRTGIPDTLSLREARELMAFAAEYQGGIMVPYFSLALFAGIRPAMPLGELCKLSRDDIDLRTNVIRIRPEVSKTHSLRVIEVQPNLREWLEAYPGPILPTNHGRHIPNIRQECGLVGRPDILRHSWFSYHVARWRSIGNAALQGGNTERIVKAFYLDPRRVTEEDAKEFWNIAPASVESNIIRIA